MSKDSHIFKLNAQRHRDVRIVPGIDLELSQLTHYVELGLQEVGPAAADYPIFFMKDGSNGQLRLVALLGFNQGQNLYVHDGIWQASYLPIAIAVRPLLLAGPERILCIDEANSRVTTKTGEALFDQSGNDTNYLAELRSLLGDLSEGFRLADQLVSTLLELGLLQPIKIKIGFVEGLEQELQGLYSIHPQRLEAIGPEDLINLHDRNSLQSIYSIVQSLNQIGRLKQFYNAVSGRKIGTIKMSMGA